MRSPSSMFTWFFKGPHLAWSSNYFINSHIWSSVYINEFVVSVPDFFHASRTFRKGCPHNWWSKNWSPSNMETSMCVCSLYFAFACALLVLLPFGPISWLTPALARLPSAPALASLLLASAIETCEKAPKRRGMGPVAVLLRCPVPQRLHCLALLGFHQIYLNLSPVWVLVCSSKNYFPALQQNLTY